MSGLYNMVYGVNVVAPAVLLLLERGPDWFPRFRDAWIERLPDSRLRLAVYTRAGGGNREHWKDECDAGPECDCTGCVMTHRVITHPLYIEDRDDNFDSTYATIYFRMPEDAEIRMRKFAVEKTNTELPEDWTPAKLACPPVDMSKRWKAAIAALRSHEP